MLNKFEQVDNMSAGRGNKPNIATKPVLQRFQQAKENASSMPTTPSSSSLSSSSSSSSTPNPVLKTGHPPAVKLAGLTGPIPALKPTTTKNASNNSGDKGGRVSVPKAFQNGQESNNSNDNDTTTNNNNNNNNDSDTTPPWKLKSHLAKPTTNSSSASPNETPITRVPKFPTMRPSDQTLTNTDNSSKPQCPPWKSEDNKNVEKSNSKTAILPTKFNSKTDSIKSNSSNSSSSSSSSSSSDQTATVSSPSTPSTKSPPSPSSQSTNGKFDFQSQLRKVNTSSSSGPPGRRVLSGISSDSSSSETPALKTRVSTTSSNASTASSSLSSTNNEKSRTQSRVPPIPWSDSVIKRPKSDQTTENVLVRKSDGKRFRKLPPPSHKPSATPKKPAAPTHLDLTSIRQQYQRLKASSDSSQDGQPVPETTQVEDDDDLYWEGMTDVSSPPPPPKRPVNEVSRASQRISLIPDMTAEEEEGEELPVYDDTPIEEEFYVDAISEKPSDREPNTSTSSEPTETEQEKKKRLKEEAAARKKEEKEKRDKEKREREEEKKRKKKEEEEMRLRNKFNLTGNEKMVGEGVIKQDARASGLNLKVKKGQIVTIVRLDSNPPNKWLVKVDTQLGYVDSQNIEVDPSIIRQAMTGQTDEDFDQPTYDDVPEENGPTSGMPLLHEEEDGEEIYEFCE